MHVRVGVRCLSVGFGPKLRSDRDSGGIACGINCLCQVERVKMYLSLFLALSLFLLFPPLSFLSRYNKKERQRNSYEKHHRELSVGGTPLRLPHVRCLCSRQHTTMCSHLLEAVDHGVFHLAPASDTQARSTRQQLYGGFLNGNSSWDVVMPWEFCVLCLKEWS